MLIALTRHLVTVITIFSLQFTSSAIGEGDVSHDSALSEIMSRVTSTTLSNGMRVVWYQKPDSNVFSGAVVVRVGGVDEPQGYTGIAHLLEHMAFKGTPTIGTRDYDKEKKLLAELEQLQQKKIKRGPLDASEEVELKRINDELQKVWIADDFSLRYDMEGAVGTNASTAKELTKYFNSMPKDAFEFWCYMESSRLLRPVMRQFYKEKDVVLEERRMRFEDSVDGKLYEKLIATAFNEHPYHQPVIGYERDLAKLTATDLSEFHKKHYVPKKIVIGIVGGIDPKVGIPLVEKYFGQMPAREAPLEDFPVEPPQEGERIVTLEKGDSPQAYVGYHKPAYPHPDDVPLMLASEMLVGSQTSPIRKKLILEDKKALDISYFDVPGVMFPGLMTFGLTPAPGVSIDELITLFTKELSDDVDHGLNEQLLTEAKKRISVSFLSSFKDSSELAMSLASSELLYGSWRENIKWYDRVQQVTLDQVRGAAKKYFITSERTVAKSLPAKK